MSAPVVPLTAQEIFDRAVGGVMRQGRPSGTEDSECANMDPELLCAYRGPNGLKCAAGHLIADEHYHPDFDERNLNSSSPTVRMAIEKSIGYADLRLIQALQGAHDRSSAKPLNEWRESFVNLAREAAARHELDASIIDRTTWGEAQPNG